MVRLLSASEKKEGLRCPPEVELLCQSRVLRGSHISEKPPVRRTTDSRDRVDESLRYLLPQDSNMPYDMKNVVKKVGCKKQYLIVYA